MVGGAGAGPDEEREWSARPDEEREWSAPALLLGGGRVGTAQQNMHLTCGLLPGL